MSIDNNALRKLDMTGMSFGSMASGPDSSGGRHSGSTGVDMIDGGLDNIGTSFGSISITSEAPPVAAMFPNYKQQYQQQELDVGAAAMPTFLQQQRSTGNLLECSDTESDDSESARGKNMRKSQEWQKLRAMLDTSNMANASINASVPPYYSQNPSTDTGFGNMGNSSNNAGGDSYYNQYYPNPQGGGSGLPYADHSQGHLHQHSYGGSGSGNTFQGAWSSQAAAYGILDGSVPVDLTVTETVMPSPPPMVAGPKKDYVDDEDFDVSTREHLEMMFLNRGDSLAFEEFSTANAASAGGRNATGGGDVSGAYSSGSGTAKTMASSNAKVPGRS
jgi:hypothetical protein